MIVVDNCFGSLVFYHVKADKDFKDTVIVVDDQNRRIVRFLQHEDDMPEDLKDVLEKDIKS